MRIHILLQACQLPTALASRSIPFSCSSCQHSGASPLFCVQLSCCKHLVILSISRCNFGPLRTFSAKRVFEWLCCSLNGSLPRYFSTKVTTTKFSALGAQISFPYRSVLCSCLLSVSRRSCYSMLALDGVCQKSSPLKQLCLGHTCHSPRNYSTRFPLYVFEKTSKFLSNTSLMSSS